MNAPGTTSVRTPWDAPRYAALLSLLLLTSVTTVDLTAQEPPDRAHVTLAFTAGRHFLGLEAGVVPLRRLAFVGLMEGGWSNRAVRGIGLRFDPHVERSGRVYAHVLFGSMRCTTPWETFTCTDAAEAWRRAWNPGAGIEMRLHDEGAVWLGLDVSRWIAFDRDVVGRELEHFAAAAVLRLRM